MRITLKKLNAGALQYTIFISVLILLLVSSFISFSYLQQKTKIRNSFIQENIIQVDQSFDYLAKHQIPYNQEINLPDHDNSEYGSTNFIKQQWGVFDLVISKSQTKKEVFKKVALIGGQALDKPALYLKENNKPLVLVGHTKIIGKAVLPKRGVRRGNIAGNSYYGSQLIYGTTQLSKSSLPRIGNKEAIKNLVQNYDAVSNFKRFELKENMNLVNSFYDQTLLFEDIGTIDLRFVSLTGNIIIRSKSKIRISNSAQLKDVILIAPIIEIENEGSGNFQAFATKQIIVNKGCNLRYPTALVVYEKNKIRPATNNDSNENQQEPIIENQITIGSNSKVKGIITFFSDNEESNYNTQILIEENATISGEVYCEKNIDLRGTVEGTVYTDNFIAKQFGSVYINHIFNGKITAPELPIQYCGLQFLETSNKVAKWMY